MKDKTNQFLLVEGKDDEHVIYALCEKFKVPETFQVIDSKGIENLFNQIPVRLKSGINSLGIIIDADLDINSRYLRLKQIFGPIDFNLPEEMPKNGLIISNPEDIKIGIWIMPNNQISGMLEDFISFLVSNDDKLMPVVDETLNKIENDSLNKYKQIHKSKARINTWLAWQEDSGTPMGLSITKKYLTTDEETCKILIDWLNNLFNV
jgi:hypothetical protein